MRRRRRGHALRRRYGRAFPRSDPRPESWTKETIVGKVLSVEPTAGYITLELPGRDGGSPTQGRARFMNIDYHAAGSSSRAYDTLVKMRSLVGKTVQAEATYHSAFGWTIFNRRSIKVIR